MLARFAAGPLDLPRCVTDRARRPPPAGFLPDMPPACETIPDVTPVEGDSPFLLACRRKPVPYTPVWYMRQAGRSLPEYRIARSGMAMLDACRKPELITEITLQPLRRYAVDAAILFSD